MDALLLGGRCTQGQCGRRSAEHAHLKATKSRLRARSVSIRPQAAQDGVDKQQQQRQAGRTKALSLQKELAAARDARSVLTLVRADGDAFDAINTATALHRIALSRTPQTPAVLKSDADGWLRLCDLLAHHSGAQDAQGVSNLLWGLARLAEVGVPVEAEQVHPLLRALDSAPLLQRAAPTALANVAWAYARLAGSVPGVSMDGDRLLRVVAVAAELAPAGGFKPQELSNLLWACATAGVALPEPQREALAAAFLAAAEAARPQEIGTGVWALVKLRHSLPADALKAAMQKLLARGAEGEADSQAIANVLWAAGTSGTALGPALTQGAVDALQRRGDDTHANALALWACTHLKHDPGKDFMATALRAAAAAAQALRPIDVAHTMYGSVQLGYAPGPAAARALLSAVEAQLPAYDELQLAMVATALAMMEVPPPDSVAARLAKYADKFSSAGSGTPFRTEDEQAKTTAWLRKLAQDMKKKQSQQQ